MMKKIKNRFVNETIESKTNEIMEKLKLNKGKSFDYVEENLYEIEVSEGETCEQCGGEMKEGETCEQCGMKEEVIYEVEVEEGETCEQCDSDEMEEGNAFTDALRKTKKGGGGS